MKFKIYLIFVFIITSFIYSECENDYSSYGSENCDTAWEEYGLNCAILTEEYAWDCTGCNCPGDEGNNNNLCWEFNQLEGSWGWVECDDSGWEFDIPGCTDEFATNYNENANIDDGTCYYGWSQEACLNTECGQMLQAGLSCEEIIYYYGADCSECEACNHSSTCGDNECSEGENFENCPEDCDPVCEDNEVLDCSDSDCCPTSWLGDGYCDGVEQPYGCDLSCYDNDGGDCEPEQEDIYGCTDSAADNYNPDATIDDGTCLYGGCLEGEVQDCINPDVCIESSFIGDGWCQDGSNANYNFDLSCYNNDGGDCDSQEEELDLTLTLLSPQGGEHIEDYTNVEVRWAYEGSDTTSIYLSFNCSYYLGGGLIEVENNIPLGDRLAVIDLSEDIYGEEIDAETIYANFKIIASDTTGVTTQVECSDEFIIGNPLGEMNVNYIDEESSDIVIDWAWMEDQTIVISDQAILDLSSQGYEYIKIYDTNAINTDTCDEITTGLVVLGMIDIRDVTGVPALTLPCGFDYCDEGGDRLIGYSPGSEIKFATGWFQQTEFQIYPTSPQLINDSMTFNNSTYIIDSFNFGTAVNIPYIMIDDRDWDEFNVYGKVTNHQGSSTRTCNNDGICDADESLVDCFDDCCDIPGSGDDEDWCLVEHVVGISNFQDNLTSGNYVPYVPSGTSSATFNYRVWLLNDDGDQVVKTIDTEINYQADDLFCEGLGDLNNDTNVNVVDVVILTNHILGIAPIVDPIVLCEADIDGDSFINVVDVVALVNIILTN